MRGIFSFIHSFSSSGSCCCCCADVRYELKRVKKNPLSSQAGSKVLKSCFNSLSDQEWAFVPMSVCHPVCDTSLHFASHLFDSKCVCANLDTRDVFICTEEGEVCAQYVKFFFPPLLCTKIVLTKILYQSILKFITCLERNFKRGSTSHHILISLDLWLMSLSGHASLT